MIHFGLLTYLNLCKLKKKTREERVFKIYLKHVEIKFVSNPLRFKKKKIIIIYNYSYYIDNKSLLFFHD